MSDKPRAGVNLHCRTLTALLRPAALLAMALARTARADSAEALHDNYQTLTSQLKYNAFNKPLVLSSVETFDRLSGKFMRPWLTRSTGSVAG